MEKLATVTMIGKAGERQEGIRWRKRPRHADMPHMPQTL